MKSERIVYTECQVTGQMGFVFKKILNKSNGDIQASTNGFLIAHDLLEHQNGIQFIGSVWDELEALGASWFIRGQMGVLGGLYHSPSQAIASDLLNLAQYVSFTRIKEKLKSYDLIRVSSSLSHDLLDILDNLEKSSIQSEFDIEISDSDFIAYRKYCFYHMIKGYRKAKKRFGNPYLAYSIFQGIESKINSLEKYYNLYEGAEFSLSYDKKANVYVKPINHYDY